MTLSRNRNCYFNIYSIVWKITIFCNNVQDITLLRQCSDPGTNTVIYTKYKSDMNVLLFYGQKHASIREEKPIRRAFNLDQEQF